MSNEIPAVSDPKTTENTTTALGYVTKRKPTMCLCDLYLVSYAPEAAT